MSWLPQHGELARRISAHDWAATPLGAVGTWPQSLRVAVRLILGIRQPMMIWWGRELIQLYNDPCVTTHGPGRRPLTLGWSAWRDWADVWQIMGPQVEQVMAGGEATWHQEALVPVFRNGRWEPARWDYGFSPIDEPSAPNGVGGVLVICKEVTEEHAQREALRASEARLQAAVDLVGLCPYTWDLTTDTREWDDRLRAIWGLPPGTRVDTKVFLSGIHPDDRPRIEAAMAACTDPSGNGVYHVEYRVIGIADKVERWVSAHGQTIFSEGRPVSFIGAAIDITDQKRAEQRLRASEEQLRLMVAELQHRTRNLLGVVSSMSKQTLAGSDSLNGYDVRFQARLAALGRANGLLSRLQGGERITFDALIRTELFAHGAVEKNGYGHQASLEGPEGVRLRSSMVQTLALGLHELATNAVKYGALSRPEGRLQVRWSVLNGQGDEQRLLIEWEETGVPVSQHTAPQPLRRGFGRQLIEQALPYQLGAKASHELHPDGLRCTITLPLVPAR